MTKRMTLNVDFLSDLQHASPGGKRRLIRASTRPEISTLNEISKNILQRRMKMTPKQRQQLSRYKNLLRKMADKRVPFQRKKKMIWRSARSHPTATVDRGTLHQQTNKKTLSRTTENAKMNSVFEK